MALRMLPVVMVALVGRPIPVLMAPLTLVMAVVVVPTLNNLVMVDLEL
jgi:hypothetical protein